MDGQVDCTALSLNNKCSRRRQRQCIIKQEAWTVTTLKFKSGIHGSFQESFSAHNSTLLFDKISDSGPLIVVSYIFDATKLFLQRDATSRMIKIFRIIHICASSMSIRQMRQILYRTEYITMMVFTLCRNNWFHSRPRNLSNVSQKRRRAHVTIQFEQAK